MSEIADLIKVMQEQLQRREDCHQQQEERHQQQEERHQQQLTVMQQQLDEQRKSAGTFASQKQTPPYPAFDLTAELWKDYLLRFKTVVRANSVSDDKLALVFLTNQTCDTYKLINNYASQQDTPTTADNMKFSDIAEFMSQHYDPTKFTVRERYKFWSSIKRKPGETPTELAARVRQMATTCDFPAIKNPLNEAMRTRFICAINNEAVLKSVFREPEEKLTFSKAVDIATEVEEAAKTAKVQVYSKPEEVHKIQTKQQYHHHQKSAPSSKQPTSTQTQCYCCGMKGHAIEDCRLSNPVCKFCGRKGHIKAACITFSHPFLVDTGASCNLLSRSTWKKIGTPRLQKDETRPLVSASNDVIPTTGTTDLKVTVTTKMDTHIPRYYRLPLQMNWIFSVPTPSIRFR